MFHDTPLYEVNRFAPWELFCSAFRAHEEAERSKSPMERLHHNRTLLLFSFAFLEALLNYSVRKFGNEEDVRTLLRYKEMKDKINFIEKKVGTKVDRTEFEEINKSFKDFRAEIVHFKRSDHQPQFFAQFLDSKKLIRLMQALGVRIFLLTEKEFPYWLTGWNYTGFNSNIRDLLLSNNGNGFGYSLGNMGFKFKPLCGPGMMSFSEGHMSTLEHFKEICSFLVAYGGDAEPVSSLFPTRPRLLKNWWCQASLEAAEREVMQARGML